MLRQWRKHFIYFIIFEYIPNVYDKTYETMNLLLFNMYMIQYIHIDTHIKTSEQKKHPRTRNKSICKKLFWTTCFPILVCLCVVGTALETAKESNHRPWLHNVVPRAPWAPATRTHIHTLAPLNPGDHSCKTRALLCTHLPCWAVWAERQRERIGEGTGFRRPGRCLLILPWLPWQ